MMDPEQIKGWTFKLKKLYLEIVAEKGLALQECTLRICPLKNRLGEWNASARTISLSLETLSQGSFDDIVHVLKHEMAHQLVDEVFQRSDRPHGDSFASACQLLGINSKATYSLSSGSSDPVVRKIEKLMALSGSSNENEAMAALAKAQELSFKYNVDILKEENRQYSLRPLGKIRRRTPSSEWTLINILTEFYFVQALHIYHQVDPLTIAWQFEIYGTPQNIDTAEYVYAFLQNQAELLWKAYRQKNGKSVSRKRVVFMSGLFQGFRSKLGIERQELKDKFAMVHLEDPQLTSFFKECNPRIRTKKVSIRNDKNVYSDGVEQGKSINIRPGLNKGSGQPVAYLE
jgi:hypothetical protein